MGDDMFDKNSNTKSAVRDLAALGKSKREAEGGRKRKSWNRMGSYEYSAASRDCGTLNVPLGLKANVGDSSH